MCRTYHDQSTKNIFGQSYNDCNDLNHVTIHLENTGIQDPVLEIV
jgi:hypothetical protein